METDACRRDVVKHALADGRFEAFDHRVRRARAGKGEHGERGTSTGDRGGRQHPCALGVEAVEGPLEDFVDDPAAVGRAHELLDEQRIATGPGVEASGVD
jgi:hypothetical protein